MTPAEAADKFIRGKSAHQLLAWIATREDVPAAIREIAAADGRRLSARVSAREEAALAAIA